MQQITVQQMYNKQHIVTMCQNAAAMMMMCSMRMRGLRESHKL